MILKLNKMKNLYLILISFVIIACSGNEDKNNITPPKSDLEDMRMEGNVKTITFIYYNVISENPDSLEYDSKNKSYYDKNGFFTKQESYYFENKVDGYSECEYDENYLLKAIKYYDFDGEFEGRYSFKYYEDGTKKSSILYGSDDSKINKTYYEYDKNGNIIEERTTEFWSGEEAPDYNITFKYNDDNQLIEKEYNDENPEYYTKHAYTYDNKGYLIKQKMYNIHLEHIKTMKYSYSDFDEKNNWTKSLTYKNDSLVTIDFREIEYY